MDQIYAPLIGGVLIGLSSTIMLLSLGKVTGISGIFATSLLEKINRDHSWRYFFLGGLIGGGFLMKLLMPELFTYEISNSLPTVVVGGLIVGFGTRLGSGCTSGHGVCGLPRKSARSLIATLTFMLFGVITVYLKGLF